MAKIKEFELGAKLRDTVSGFEGIATSKVVFLNGCVRYGLEPKVGADGKIIEGQYFDSQQVEKVDDGLIEKVKEARTNTGGAPITKLIK
jgi:hypothetical protein